MTNKDFLLKLRHDGHVVQNSCAIKAMIGGLVMTAGLYVFSESIGKAGKIESLNKLMDAALKSGAKELDEEYK